MQARVAAPNRELSAARDALAPAQPLRPLMPMPVFALQNRIELARAYLALNDMNSARTVMHEAGEIIQRRPNLGTAVNEAEAMSSRLAKGGTWGAAGPSALTTAELRLLPMLCTHLTAAEIAAEMFLSPHTIRAQIRSIYRKLDSNSRHDAVTRAHELHLVG